MQGSPRGFIDQLCRPDALQTAWGLSWAQKQILQQGQFETQALKRHHETHQGANQGTSLRPQDQTPLLRGLLLPRWRRDGVAR